MMIFNQNNTISEEEIVANENCMNHIIEKISQLFMDMGVKSKMSFDCTLTFLVRLALARDIEPSDFAEVMKFISESYVTAYAEYIKRTELPTKSVKVARKKKK